MIAHESVADNRHFAAELTKGESLHGRRNVELSFFVWNVNEIDVVNQRFSVCFNMYASWNEDIQNIHVTVDEHRYSSESFGWSPQLRFLNCSEQSSDEYESWYRVYSPLPTKGDDEFDLKHPVPPAKLAEYRKSSHHKTQVRVMYCQRIQGWFSEVFEMQEFPFDIQSLHIGVTSSWDHECVVLTFDSQHKPSSVSSTALTSQTWDLHAPRLISYNSDWDFSSSGGKKTCMPLLSQSSDSATGARYSRCYFSLTIARRPDFFLWNIMVIITLVGFMSFATYALDPGDLGDRQACVLTLVLTTVAFKYITTSVMPEISYVTMLDAVIYSCILLQTLMMLSICVAANIDDPNRIFDFASGGALLVFWLAILAWFMIRTVALRRKRKKYLSACEKRFKSCQKRDASSEKLYTDIVMPPNYDGL